MGAGRAAGTGAFGVEDQSKPSLQYTSLGEYRLDVLKQLNVVSGTKRGLTPE